jgi:hypothetical protein
MFPVTITLHSFDQLNAVTNALGAIPAPAEGHKSIAAGVAQYLSANKAEAAGKAADKVIADTSKTAEKLQGEAKPELLGNSFDDTEKTYTVDDAKQLTNKVVAAGKRDEMVALLAEFKVNVASKLPADQIAPFCKKAEALL